MKVHHLNCGTLTPPIGERNVCHVLVIETDMGLVLVDAGLGTGDIARPGKRVGPIRYAIRPAFDPEETALAQLTALGYTATDVRHIVATHLDLDHIGGVSDFPRATLHSTAVEARTAYSTSLAARIRYNRAQLPTREQDVVGHAPGTDTWEGFDGVIPLTAISDNMAFVPLPGHTRGHAAVLVDAGPRWILHCGDAFYHRNAIEGTAAIPAGIRVFEQLTAVDRSLVHQNHERLRELKDRNDPNLLIVCAHDDELLARAQRTA